MSDDGVRAAVAAGSITELRRGVSKTWVPIAETPFGRPASVPPPERVYFPGRLADLGKKEAHKLISDAVAWGIVKASLALMGMGLLIELLWLILR